MGWVSHCYKQIPVEQQLRKGGYISARGLRSAHHAGEGMELGLVTIVTEMKMLANVPAEPETETRRGYRTPKHTLVTLFHQVSTVTELPRQCHQLGTT